jgi:regulatory LacI family protein/LacI family sugar-binding protein
MAVRLKDIARDLGVSVVTVSKVLRGNADIGEETRRRVLKRMKDLNYQPNMMARGLASGRTYTIGLVVPDLVHPFFAEFAKSLGGVLRTSNCALILASSEEDPEIEQQEIRTLLSRGVDVLLIASCQANMGNFYEPGDDRTPYLLFDRNFPHLAAHFVGSDDVKVGETATNHLVAIGRKRIAHIGGNNTSPSFYRLQGYRNALSAPKLDRPGNHGTEPDCRRVCSRAFGQARTSSQEHLCPIDARRARVHGWRPQYAARHLKVPSRLGGSLASHHDLHNEPAATKYFASLVSGNVNVNWRLPVPAGELARRKGRAKPNFVKYDEKPTVSKSSTA